MAKAKVEYTIKAKDESRQGIQSATQNVDKLGGAIQKAFSAAAITAAAVAIKKVGTELLNAYGAQEDAERKLAAAARNNPYLNDEGVRNIQEYAAELQKLTTVGDEVAISMAGMLAATGRTEEQIKSIITVSADLSAGLGISLESAVRNVNKTFGGFAGELGELIPELKELTAEQMQAGDAIALLDEKFGGMAADMAGTYSGSVQQFKNAWGDLKELLGGALAEVLLPVVGALTDMVTALGNVGKKLDEAIPKWREFARQALAAIPGIQQLMLLNDMRNAGGAGGGGSSWQPSGGTGRLDGVLALPDNLSEMAARGRDAGEAAATIIAESVGKKLNDILEKTQIKKAGMGGGGGKADGMFSAVTDVAVPDMGLGAIFGDLFGNALGPVIQAVSMLGNVMQLMQPGMVILQGLMDVIGPVINEALAPFVQILTIIGQIAGQLLLPVLKPIAWIFQAIADAIYTFIKWVVKAINALIPGKRWDISIPDGLGDAGGGEEPVLVDDSSGGGSGGGTYSTGRTSYNYVTITAEVVAGDGGLRELAMMIRGELEALDAIGV